MQGRIHFLPEYANVTSSVVGPAVIAVGPNHTGPSVGYPFGPCWTSGPNNR